jgi:hypothetical protein
MTDTASAKNVSGDPRAADAAGETASVSRWVMVGDRAAVCARLAGVLAWVVAANSGRTGLHEARER